MARISVCFLLGPLCVVAVAACDPLTPPPPPDIPEFPPIPTPATAPSAGEADRSTVETPPLASGRPREKAIPADVLSRLELVQDEVELLRLYMGRPKTRPSRLRVAEAWPRAVYWQAAGLFDAANTLSFEISRTIGAVPLETPKEPKPPDVFGIVDRTLERILITKRSLGIDQRVEERVSESDTTPTDTFHVAVAVASEIANLLRRRSSPADVYRQVTSAVHAAAAIQATLPGAVLPDEPALEPNKMPADVYGTLLECYRDTVRLAASKKIELVELQVTEADARHASSHEVGELAALLNEEMRFLHASWPRAKSAFSAYDPGLKFPSHVHQRARFLSQILSDANGRIR